MEIKDHFIDLEQGRIFAREWMAVDVVAAEPIILIHDSLGCVDLWRSFPATLCERSRRRIIAYDRLGFGRSTPRTGPLPISFIEEESQIYLPAIFRQLDIGKFIIFGHSVGGAMAVVCAGRFPDSCMAVITESAQSFVGDETLRAISDARKRFQDDGQIDRLKKYHGAKTEWVFNAWTETWLSPEFADWNLKAALPLVGCPLLAIHGDRDEYGSLEHPEMITALAGGPSQKVILSGCGHLPHRERADEVIDAVTNFITGLNGEPV